MSLRTQLPPPPDFRCTHETKDATKKCYRVPDTVNKNWARGQKLRREGQKLGAVCVLSSCRGGELYKLYPVPLSPLSRRVASSSLV